MAKFHRAIGLMSGTSLDGVDVALLSTDGERIADFGPAQTFPYTDADRTILRRAFSEAMSLNDRKARPGVLADAETVVTTRHAEAVEAFLKSSAIGSVDLVGFHGQTVFHDPARALTVQIGDGHSLADRLKIPVVWDFRAADVEAGGQGAPLAPAFHRALAETAGAPLPALFLNIGGVANVTYIGADGALIAFDTGPGNSLLDDWTRQRTGRPFDADGRLAAAGSPSPSHLDEFLRHPYFAAPPPKSLDRNAFSLESIAALSDADGAATLLHFSAHSIADSLDHLPARPKRWFASGGGRHNSALMRTIANQLPGVDIQPLEALGFDGDATEAQAFAFLAVRSAAGMPISYPMTTGVPSPMAGGILTHPQGRG